MTTLHPMRWTLSAPSAFALLESQIQRTREALRESQESLTRMVRMAEVARMAIEMKRVRETR